MLNEWVPSYRTLTAFKFTKIFKIASEISLFLLAEILYVPDLHGQFWKVAEKGNLSVFNNFQNNSQNVPT